MHHFICRQCGTQYDASPRPPDECVICSEERQYVRWGGQDWTTLEMIAAELTARVEDEAESITGIGSAPDFAIGQRALLLQSPAGNVLWDCISLLNDTLVSEIEARGGISAIAISHPHYYTTMIEWSAAFGDVPIYLHADDAQWVQRDGPQIVSWSGETLDLNREMTLIRCGGHFDGASILHWPGAFDGAGALFAGDTLQVCMDRRHVSFMYSYPNLIPLDRAKIQAIGRSLDGLTYDKIFGGWWRRNIMGEANAAVRNSVRRYLTAIGDGS